MRDVSRCMLVLALGALMVAACDPASPGPKPTPHANSAAGPSTSPVAARQASSHRAFATPEYFDWVSDDAFFNTVGPSGDIITTANDSIGVHFSCTRRGTDVAILALHGPDPQHLVARTVNCMPAFGPRGGGRTPDGCSWKTGGITRIGHVIYLAVARQLHRCSRGRQDNGIQPSFDASVLASTDGGRTWRNPWGTTSRRGAAPPWDPRLHRYRAMFPGRRFSVPFFIQYGPGNTQTADGANRFLYAVSTEGFAYNASYLHLARVPLGKVQQARAWRFYHGRVGGHGRSWSRSVKGATRVLQARRGISQPAIQYVPALKRYLLFTFVYSRARSDFPRRAETPYTRLRLYIARKPWGPWTRVFDHRGRRDLWCAARPCPLTREPGQAPMTIGRPSDWLGLYDPALVQKFVFTGPLTDQAILTCGDWKNKTRYPGELLNRLLVIPTNLRALIAR